MLKAIRPLTMDQLLVGQYTASLDGSKPGYQDDKTVPKGSICPTYAAMVLFVDNERWAGVPWILKAGKGEWILHNECENFAAHFFSN